MAIKQSVINHRSFAWFMFVGFVALLALTMSFQINYLPTGIKSGQKAPKDIKASESYTVVDETTTGVYRREAVNNVLPVFDYDPHVYQDLLQKLNQTFDEIDRRVKNHAPLDRDELADYFNEQMGIKLSLEQSQLFYEYLYSQATHTLLVQTLSSFMNDYIIGDQDQLEIENNNNVMLRVDAIDKISDEAMIPDELVLKETHGLMTIEKIKEKTEIILNNNLSLKEAQKKVFAQIVFQFIKPNVFLNERETERLKLQAYKNVPEVTLTVDAGDYIIRSGETYSERHVVLLHGIQKQREQSNVFIKFVGTMIFIAMLLLILYFFAFRYVRKFKPSFNDLVFIGTNLMITLLMVRFAASLSTPIKESLPIDLPSQTLLYAIPMAGTAMLIRFILNSEIALVFAFAATSLAGLFLRSELAFSVYFLMSSVAGCNYISFADKRSSIIKAGLWTGLINCILIFSIKLIHYSSVTEVLGSEELFATMIFGFLGGVMSSVYVMMVAPVAEWVFDYTSDITLLELGNSNHPLLQEMIMKAPGTYHHSQLVAILAENAARRIGANPLLCRVGAYFHDIGKMKKSHYFIENQQGGENRHDKLMPSMSALIISSHVKDGLELAKQYKLPARIAAFIPEHQGTKLITYFYNKAKQMDDPHHPGIEENDYRYPGPRPQSRESGIIMLADGAEAAVRAMSEKTPPKIQATVQKIINKNFSEEQLDECELTLRDLHGIGESFIKVLQGIYHQRIEYPETPGEKNEKPTITLIKNETASGNRH